MALTNAQLLRELAGDPGQFVREYLSGDASATLFYLKGRPLLRDAATITVGGAARTEVASSPGATEYTLDDSTGLVTFGAAPASGTDNIVASYYIVEMPDATVDEAIRLVGLTGSSAADTGPAASLLTAAALACDIMAARTVAKPSSVSVDGQSISRRSAADWHALAKELRTATASAARTIVSIPIIRIDGYNINDASTRDIGATDTNPRRAYYGQEDRLP